MGTQTGKAGKTETLYAVRYRGCYKGDSPPDTANKEIGRIYWWPMSKILEEINSDRSSGWTDYDKTDWAEGLDEWTWYEPVLDKDGKPLEKEEQSMKFIEDPTRITTSMDEDDDIDELIEALANNVAANPDNVHSVSTTAVAASSADVSSFSIEVTFRNQVGQTRAVDGILEKLNMWDWRIFCDKFLVKVLESSGRNPDAYDWPTPHPEVTKIPEEDDTDIIASVRIKWSLDVETWLAAARATCRKIGR